MTNTRAWKNLSMFTLQTTLETNRISMWSIYSTWISCVLFLCIYLDTRISPGLTNIGLINSFSIKNVLLWICLNGVNTVMMSIMQHREYHVFPSWYHEIFHFFCIWDNVGHTRSFEVILYGHLTRICGYLGFWIIILIIWTRFRHLRRQLNTKCYLIIIDQTGSEFSRYKINSR